MNLEEILEIEKSLESETFDDLLMDEIEYIDENMIVEKINHYYKQVLDQIKIIKELTYKMLNDIRRNGRVQKLLDLIIKFIANVYILNHKYIYFGLDGTVQERYDEITRLYSNFISSVKNEALNLTRYQGRRGGEFYKIDQSFERLYLPIRENPFTIPEPYEFGDKVLTELKERETNILTVKCQSVIPCLHCKDDILENDPMIRCRHCRGGFLHRRCFKNVGLRCLECDQGFFQNRPDEKELKRIEKRDLRRAETYPSRKKYKI